MLFLLIIRSKSQGVERSSQIQMNITQHLSICQLNCITCSHGNWVILENTDKHQFINLIVLHVPYYQHQFRDGTSSHTTPRKSKLPSSCGKLITVQHQIHFNRLQIKPMNKSKATMSYFLHRLPKEDETGIHSNSQISINKTYGIALYKRTKESNSNRKRKNQSWFFGRKRVTWIIQQVLLKKSHMFIHFFFFFSFFYQ